MSAGERFGLAEGWSAKQAGAIVESLLSEFPTMRVTFELPPDPDGDGHIPALARANERAFAVADRETSV